MEITKVCTGPCGLNLPLSSYGNHPEGKFGKQPRCRKCCNLANKEFEKKFPEKARQHDINWRSKNTDKVKGYTNKYARANRPKQREWFLRTKYGITPEQWDEILKSQNGVCAICKTCPENGLWHTDHNHTTNKARGILCSRCNHALGLFKESSKSLLSAIAYLEKYKENECITETPTMI
jgi:hypothetical protein